MKQLFLMVNDGTVKLIDTPAPTLKDNHAIIETEYSIVSAGTERGLASFGGKNLIQKALERPDQVKKVMEKMSTDGILTTMESFFTRLAEPMPMGYSGVGKVVSCGRGVTEVSVGDHVAMVGQAYHSEVNRVNKNLIVKIPDDADDVRQYSMCALAGIALQGIHQAKVEPGETVAVIGLGLLGHIASRILNAYGCDVIAYDSVCPAWKAVSSAAYEEICRSVYSKDELEGIVHEAGIFAGVEHSNVRSLALSEYEVPYGAYFIRPGNAVLTFSAQGLKFNASCHMRLDHRRFVEILYHPILEAVIVRACDANAENAFCWEDDGEKMRTSIAAKEFTQIVYERMRWIPEYRFQFRGVLRVRGEKKLLMFYLDEPRILIGKGKRAQIEESLSEEERHSAVRFIPYKVDDIKTEDDIWKSSTVAAYPHEWENCGGMNLTLRKRRDRLLNSLTPDDIAAESVVVTNPIIGSVPGRDELNDMVKKLLAAL